MTFDQNFSYMNPTQELVNNAQLETDRACALVLTADLENRLKLVLESFFIEASRKKNKELFDGNGPFSTFSSRISLAYSSGLISNHEHHDLKLIKNVRNKFAHTEGNLKFDDEEITSWCLSMEITKGLAKNDPEPVKNPRQMYVVAASALSVELRTKAERAKSDKRKVPPNMRINTTNADR